MSYTPRTDAYVSENKPYSEFWEDDYDKLTDFARELERELTRTKEALKEAIELLNDSVTLGVAGPSRGDVLDFIERTES